MIRLSQVQLSIEKRNDISALKQQVVKLLKLKKETTFQIDIEKEALDARKKPSLYYNYTVLVKVDNEHNILKKSKLKENQGKIIDELPSILTFKGEFPLNHRPVVIGCGPAGLFCTYYLAKAGYKPILLERGLDVDARQLKVEEFWKTRKLNTSTNVQFGEGGAGTFSDGKLGSLIKDKANLKHEVFKILVDCGAPSQILYSHQPHIGTDILSMVVKNLRNKIIQLGGEVRFSACMTDLDIQNNQIQGLWINDSEYIETKTLVLAIGHSARDTFEKLFEKQIPMEAKSFAVGFRIQHLQRDIDENQYGLDNVGKIEAASYKLNYNDTNGRGVYSFCMCPGGHVVNASSEEGYLAVNGMSYHARNSSNANSAIVVSVSESDFEGNHPLKGMYFQREIEKNAFLAANGNIPIQYFKNFEEDVNGQLNTVVNQSFFPVCKGDYEFTSLVNILPKELNETMCRGIRYFGKKIKGFDQDEALLAGVESRTSSPIRILRNKENFMSNIQGLYPCGEGAGYAGGITSAAIDGLKIGHYIAERKSIQ